MILKFEKGIHHLYIGLVLMAVGYFASTYWSHSLVVYVIGAWLVLDDLYQHRRQVKEPSYHSPVHRFYGLFYHISWIRALNIKADKLFGVDNG